MPSFIASLALLALAALPSTLAAPPRFFGCPITVRPVVPAGQTLVVPNPALKVQFVGLGLGTQNYSCSAEGKPVSAGAVATLYDVSCLSSTPFFATLPDFAVNLGGSRARTAVSAGIAQRLGSSPIKLGDHFFIANAAGGISPEFDLTPSQKKSSFVIAKKTGNVASPLGTANVDLLQLDKVNGTIGTQVLRLDTRLGQPLSATCTPGSPITTSPYVAVYWFLA